eukprot:GHVL01030995.1.p1 GENE.GHVL01030995.1~~GHVL01030995.1.p1  ORF type:complete len:1101 (-),score=153.79 GHVL01030995.1:1503-4805(-)
MAEVLLSTDVELFQICQSLGMEAVHHAELGYCIVKVPDVAAVQREAFDKGISHRMQFPILREVVQKVSGVSRQDLVDPNNKIARLEMRSCEEQSRRLKGRLTIMPPGVNTSPFSEPAPSTSLESPIHPLSLVQASSTRMVTPLTQSFTSSSTLMLQSSHVSSMLTSLPFQLSTPVDKTHVLSFEQTPNSNESDISMKERSPCSPVYEFSPVAATHKRLRHDGVDQLTSPSKREKTDNSCERAPPAPSIPQQIDKYNRCIDSLSVNEPSIVPVLKARSSKSDKATIDDFSQISFSKLDNNSVEGGVGELDWQQIMECPEDNETEVITATSSVFFTTTQVNSRCEPESWVPPYEFSSKSDQAIDLSNYLTNELNEMIEHNHWPTGGIVEQNSFKTCSNVGFDFYCSNDIHMEHKSLILLKTIDKCRLGVNILDEVRSRLCELCRMIIKCQKNWSKNPSLGFKTGVFEKVGCVNGLNVQALEYPVLTRRNHTTNNRQCTTSLSLSCVKLENTQNININTEEIIRLFSKSNHLIITLPFLLSLNDSYLSLRDFGGELMEREINEWVDLVHLACSEVIDFNSTSRLFECPVPPLLLSVAAIRGIEVAEPGFDLQKGSLMNFLDNNILKTLSNDWIESRCTSLSTLIEKFIKTRIALKITSSNLREKIVDRIRVRVVVVGWQVYSTDETQIKIGELHLFRMNQLTLPGRDCWWISRKCVPISLLQLLLRRLKVVRDVILSFKKGDNIAFSGPEIFCEVIQLASNQAWYSTCNLSQTNLGSGRRMRPLRDFLRFAFPKMLHILQTNAKIIQTPEAISWVIRWVQIVRAKAQSQLTIDQPLGPQLAAQEWRNPVILVPEEILKSDYFVLRSNKLPDKRITRSEPQREINSEGAQKFESINVTNRPRKLSFGSDPGGEELKPFKVPSPQSSNFPGSPELVFAESMPPKPPTSEQLSSISHYRVTQMGAQWRSPNMCELATTKRHTAERFKQHSNVAQNIIYQGSTSNNTTNIHKSPIIRPMSSDSQNIKYFKYADNALTESVTLQSSFFRKLHYTDAKKRRHTEHRAPISARQCKSTKMSQVLQKHMDSESLSHFLSTQSKELKQLWKT